MANFIKSKKAGIAKIKISQSHSMLIVTFNEHYIIYKLI